MNNTLLKIAKQVNARNLRKAFAYLKRHGIQGFFEQCNRRAAAESDYQEWFLKQRIVAEEIKAQENHLFLFAPKISIVVPTYHTPELFLREMIESVRAQSYINWELCIADASENNQKIRGILREYMKSDKRIRCVFLEHNKGIAANTNAALEMVKGDYIGFLDHDDLLEADALYEVVNALQEERADMLYSDEDKISSDGQRYMEPNFKPDLDMELLRSCNYITHFLVVKREMIDSIGGLRSEFNGAQDYDLIFRCVENASRVVHIPRILYHWRVNAESTAEQLRNKRYCLEAGKRSIEAHLNRSRLNATVKYLESDCAFYHTSYIANEQDKVSIISSQEDLREADGRYLLFLSKQLIKQSPDAISEMVGICKRYNVGAVGGKIISADKRIVHAGIFYDGDENNRPILAYYGEPADQLGYLGRASLNAQCDGVLTDCIMMRREVFEQIGQAFPWDAVTIDDRTKASVDFCKKIRQQGYIIVYNAFSIWQYREGKCDRNRSKKIKEFSRFGRMYEY